MSKTAIIYWSGTGNTEAMAKAIVEGARQIDSEVQLFEVSDISADAAAAFDTLILGCPAMGDEVLEENEFEPFFSALEANISGKNVALFGSYGWGDGEWMRNWETRVLSKGASIVGNEGLIINGEPDEEGLLLCRELGSKAAAL